MTRKVVVVRRGQFELKQSPARTKIIACSVATAKDKASCFKMFNRVLYVERVVKT